MSSRLPTPQQALELWQQAHGDAVFFIDSTFGQTVFPVQAEICRSVHNNPVTLVKSCHAVGKTRIAAGIIHQWCGTDTDRMAITTATTATQGSMSLWREVDKLAEIAKKRGRDTGARVLTSEAHWDKLRSVAFARTVPQGRADDVAATMFQGMRGEGGTLIIIDEATAIAAGVFLGASAILTGVKDRLLVLCNPTDPASHVARMFKDPSHARITMDAFSTPNLKPYGITEADIASGAYLRKAPPPEKTPYPYLINAHKVRQWWEEWTDHGLRPMDVRWISRIKAQFPDVGDDVLIPMPWIDAAMKLYTGKRTDDVEYGVDVADGGDDSSVITERRGPQARILRRIYGLEAEATGQAVLDIVGGRSTVPIKVDVCGIGGKVYGIALGQRLNAIGIDSSKPMSKSDVSPAELRDLGITDQDKFAGVRSLFWWMLRQRFRNSYLLYTTGAMEGPHIELEPDDKIATQLNAIKWRQRGGEIAVEKKEETKKLLNGKSPDEADSLMYAFTPGKRKPFFL